MHKKMRVATMTISAPHYHPQERSQTMRQRMSRKDRTRIHPPCNPNQKETIG